MKTKTNWTWTFVLVCLFFGVVAVDVARQESIVSRVSRFFFGPYVDSDRTAVIEKDGNVEYVVNDLQVQEELDETLNKADKDAAQQKYQQAKHRVNDMAENVKETLYEKKRRN
jgi:hypothetical protein